MPLPPSATDEDLDESNGVVVSTDAAPAPPPINLTELKRQMIHELAQIARQFEIDGASTMRKPELIFSILQLSLIHI